MTAVGATVQGLDGTPRFAWRSLHPAVATVDSAGLVAGVAPGTATIVVASRANPDIQMASTATVR